MWTSQLGQVSVILPALMIFDTPQKKPVPISTTFCRPSLRSIRNSRRTTSTSPEKQNETRDQHKPQGIGHWKWTEESRDTIQIISRFCFQHETDQHKLNLADSRLNLAGQTVHL